MHTARRYYLPSHLLNDAASVHLQRQSQDMAGHGTKQHIFLLLGPELE